MAIEWHDPVDLTSTIQPLFFVRITKSKGNRPVYSIHFLRTLNNGGHSKHLPCLYNPATGEVSTLQPVLDELRFAAESWIKNDLRRQKVS